MLSIRKDTVVGWIPPLVWWRGADHLYSWHSLPTQHTTKFFHHFFMYTCLLRATVDGEVDSDVSSIDSEVVDESVIVLNIADEVTI